MKCYVDFHIKLYVVTSTFVTITNTFCLDGQYHVYNVFLYDIIHLTQETTTFCTWTSVETKVSGLNDF